MGFGFIKVFFYVFFFFGFVDNIFNFWDLKLYFVWCWFYVKGFIFFSFCKEWEFIICEIVVFVVVKIKVDVMRGEKGVEVMGWFIFMVNEIVCWFMFGGGEDMVKKGVKDLFVVMLERRMGDLVYLFKYFVLLVYYFGRMFVLVVRLLRDVFYL